MFFVVNTRGGGGGLPCDPLLKCHFAGDSGADVSGHNMSFSLGDNTISDEALIVQNNPQTSSVYSGGAINDYNGVSWTWQLYMHWAGGGAGFASRGISAVGGFGVDNRLFIEANTTGANPHKVRYRNGIIFSDEFSSSAFPQNQWTHLALVMDHENNNMSMWFAGQRVINNSSNIEGALPPSQGFVSLGGPNTEGDGPLKITDISVYPCKLYSGDTFTPPARVGGG